MKPFTMIAALLLLAVAAAHAYRLYIGMPVDVNGETLPMWVSWVALVVPAFLGIMIFVESRR